MLLRDFCILEFGEYFFVLRCFCLVYFVVYLVYLSECEFICVYVV